MQTNEKPVLCRAHVHSKNVLVRILKPPKIRENMIELNICDLSNEQHCCEQGRDRSSLKQLIIKHTM